MTDINKQLKIFAIELGTTKQGLTEAILRHALEGKEVSDFEGWDLPAPKPKGRAANKVA